MSLNEIRPLASKDNPINSFNIFSLNAGALEVDEEIVVGDLDVGGTLTVNGVSELNGNVTISNSAPSLEIRDNATNTNMAIIKLHGRYPSVLPATIQSNEAGSLGLGPTANNQSTNITATGTGFVNLLPASGGFSVVTRPILVPLPGVTQITSKTTGVTLNATMGKITTVALTDAADTQFNFTVLNSLFTALTQGVVLQVNLPPATVINDGCPIVSSRANAAGSFEIIIRNVGTAQFAYALDITFIILG